MHIIYTPVDLAHLLCHNTAMSMEKSRSEVMISYLGSRPSPFSSYAARNSGDGITKYLKVSESDGFGPMHGFHEYIVCFNWLNNIFIWT